MYFKRAQYDYTGCAGIKNILPVAWFEKQHIDSSRMKYKGRKTHVYRRLRAVFFDFIKLVVDDCIEHNSMFTSPGPKEFSIYITEKTDKEVLSILKRGAYKDVDVINADGKIYQFYIRSTHIGPLMWRHVRIGYRRYWEMAKRVNEGKRYLQRELNPVAPKNTNMYTFMDKLVEMYPDVDEIMIRKLIRRGCQNIHNNMRKEQDVLIQSAKQDIKFLVYTWRPYNKAGANEKADKKPVQ